MKTLMNALVAHFKTQGDGFFCLLGLVSGGFALYFGLTREEIGWKLVIFGGISSLISLVFLPKLLSEGIQWLAAFGRDLSPRTVALELPAPRLLERLEVLKKVILESVARDIIPIKVGEHQAQWVDDFYLDIQLNKQSWCATVGVAGGGILFPLEYYRITQKAPIKLPKRFETAELTSCILCWEKQQLSIFPKSMEDTLLEELTIGLFAPDEAAFKRWLAVYQQRLAEDFAEEA